MKKFCGLIVFILLSAIAFSQQNNLDVVSQKYASSINSNGNALLKKGYQGIAGLGYAFALDDFSEDFVKVIFINGYRISPYVFLGLGTGLNYYYDKADLVIPCFADFRVNRVYKTVTPYAALDVGCSFDVTIDYDVSDIGILLSPAVGAFVKISDKAAMNVGIGFEIQTMDINYYYSDHSFFNLRESFSYLSINVGIMF